MSIVHIWNPQRSPITIQPPSHLHAEFQHHSSHQFFNVQSVSLWEGGGGSGSVKARERKAEGEKEVAFCFPLPKNGESEQSPGTVHLTLPL